MKNIFFRQVLLSSFLGILGILFFSTESAVADDPEEPIGESCDFASGPLTPSCSELLNCPANPPKSGDYCTDDYRCRKPAPSPNPDGYNCTMRLCVCGPTTGEYKCCNIPWF